MTPSSIRALKKIATSHPMSEEESRWFLDRLLDLGADESKRIREEHLVKKEFKEYRDQIHFAIDKCVEKNPAGTTKPPQIAIEDAVKYVKKLSGTS